MQMRLTPGVEQHVLSHATIAPAVVDPLLVRELSDRLLDKSPIHLPCLSTHPDHKALVPLIGLETGSVRMARQIMPSKGVPFPIEEWPSVVVRGLEILNSNNWFPAMTLIIGSPGETDEDCRATIDLIYEVERRGLFAFFIPSIFTPLHDTRMEHSRGVAETRELTQLQWQLMMKCWKMNLRPGQNSWWAPPLGGSALSAFGPSACGNSTVRDSRGRCSCSRMHCPNRPWAGSVRRFRDSMNASKSARSTSTRRSVFRRRFGTRR
jgi:hypothetical protein